MIERVDLHYAGGVFGRTIWAAFAIWGALSLGLMFVSGVVIGMHPIQESWCRGEGYVQARFKGYKLKDWWPVAGSFGGQIRLGERTPDVPFSFVNDPTPGSSKPIGWQGFGIWRWEHGQPEAVRMTMRHTNGTDEVLSSFGFFDVPGDLPDCLEGGLQ